MKPNNYKKIETMCFFLVVPCMFRGWERNDKYLVFTYDEGDLVEKLNVAADKLLEEKK